MADNRADTIAAAADEVAGECADRRAEEQRVGVEGDNDGGFGAGAVDPVVRAEDLPLGGWLITRNCGQSRA